MPSNPADRCGEPKRHLPHWHGARDGLWCDGKYYTPTFDSEEAQD